MFRAHFQKEAYIQLYFSFGKPFKGLRNNLKEGYRVTWNFLYEKQRELYLMLFFFFCEQADLKTQMSLMSHQQRYSFVFGIDLISMKHDMVYHQKI